MTRPVLGLVVPPAAGGIVAHVRSLVERLPDLGWSVRVCAPAAVLGRLAGGASASPPGVDLVAVRWPAGRGRSLDTVRAGADLRAALAGVDAVSAQGLRAGAVVPAAPSSPRSGDHRPPLVVTWHNPPPGRAAGPLPHLAGQVLARRAARRATVTLAASTDLLHLARAAGADHARLLEVAASPTGAGDPDRARAVRAALAPGGRALVLTVGRLARQKDQASAVLAVALLPADRRPVLAVAGEGPERGALAALAAAHGVDLRLLGDRRDVADLLLAADVALLCSGWEARSLFAQEALRAGVPLVATAVGGVADLVGDAAVLVAPDGWDQPSASGPGLPAALARALARVLDDPAVAGGLAAAGPVRAAGWPDEDATARTVVSALDWARLLAWDSVER